MWPVDRPRDWVGRGQELAILQAGIEALGRGEGAVVWVEGEPGIGKSSLSGAVAHYRAAGPAVELPAALEDLAVVLAEHGRETDARAALNEAVSRYEDLQARWDIRRARSQRPPAGRHSPPTEVKIAALVARGDSTSDIARGMFLSRRTVQTYISHILVKLGAKGRVEIVREALRQGVSP